MIPCIWQEHEAVGFTNRPNQLGLADRNSSEPGPDSRAVKRATNLAYPGGANASAGVS